MLSSPVEWGIVAAAALLLFGPKKFPEIGRALGQGIGNFKRALTDAQDQVVAGIEEGEKGQKGKKTADKAPEISDKSDRSDKKVSAEVVEEETPATS
jgi:sec-independent protein translocase protein TatA